MALPAIQFDSLYRYCKNIMDEQLPSNAQKPKCTKEQILICYLGLGWEEAHHLWSKDGYHYTDVELLDYLVKSVIPLSKTNKVPLEALLEMP